MSTDEDLWPQQARWSRGLWIQIGRAFLDLLLLPGRLLWSTLTAGSRRRRLAERLRQRHPSPGPKEES